MTHTYKVTGMTCESCEAKVKSSLLMLPNITEVAVSKATQSATISMDKHISLSALQNSLDKKYLIAPMGYNEPIEQAKSWFAIYKPILLIFGYVTLISLIVPLEENGFYWMRTMNIFMAGFFLTFSFFKLLDLKGFAESYRMYDIIAKKIPSWGYFYAFIELALGIAYAINLQQFTTNIVTLIIMSISIIGVLESVFNKRKVQCACLGTVFQLPMTTVTIIEDSLMIAMSAGMIYLNL